MSSTSIGLTDGQEREATFSNTVDMTGRSPWWVPSGVTPMQAIVIHELGHVAESALESGRGNGFPALIKIEREAG